MPRNIGPRLWQAVRNGPPLDTGDHVEARFILTSRTVDNLTTDVVVRFSGTVWASSDGLSLEVREALESSGGYVARWLCQQEQPQRVVDVTATGIDWPAELR